MSEVLKESLASWFDAHGFGVLCIQSSRGERFLVVPHDQTQIASVTAGETRLRAGSEAEARVQLEAAGFAAADIDDAIRLSREWATTVTPDRRLWGLSS